MDEQILTATPDAVRPAPAVPYPPSYVDRLMGTIERLPGPAWLAYLLFFLLHGFLAHLVAWIDGWVPPFQLSPLNLLYPVWLWGSLAAMTYLDATSQEALSRFSPLLKFDENRMKRLRYEFTTMPARPVLIVGVIWAIFFFVLSFLAFEAFNVAYGVGRFGTIAGLLIGVLSFFISSSLYYHSIRQLLLVNRTVKTVREFNLFRLDPVYAFSGLTARTGVAWVILLSLTVVLFPIELASAPVLAMWISQPVLAIAAFALPLWIVHRRLVEEKRGLLAELNRRLEATLGRLHRCLDKNELSQIDQLNSAISGLKAEREVLVRIPTWPWRVGTLTGFLSAIVLPLILFFVQLVIENLMGS